MIAASLPFIIQEFGAGGRAGSDNGTTFRSCRSTGGERYPSQRHMGSAILNLSTDGRKMAGFWIGFTQAGTMAQGSVTRERRTGSG